jgi:hypothetical protein
MADGSPLVGANYQTARLGVGRHNGPGPVVCIMELASMLAGERFSDHPVSVCPIIGALLRAYNDDVDDARRPDLYRYAAESVGTRGSFALQRQRAGVALDWGRGSYARRGRVWHRRVHEPRPDHGPDEIAFYVVRSLRRRHDEDSHASMLALLDRLIAMAEDGSALSTALDQCESVSDAISSNISASRSSTADAALSSSMLKSDSALVHSGS